MADQIELLKEANRRGILPESKRALFDEAVKRGLITLDAPATPDKSQTSPPEQPLSAGDVVIGAVTNLLPSTGRVIKDTANAIAHPIDTAKSLYNLAGSAADLIIPGENGNEGIARGVGDFFKNRYGGVENIKKTIASDPAGAAMDVSALLTGGGSLAAKAPSYAGKIGEVLKVAGQSIDPINAAMKGASFSKAGVVKAVPDFIKGALSPEGLYESAMKFSNNPNVLSPIDRRRAIQTGLQERMLPNEESYTRLWEQVRDNKAKVNKFIQEGTSEGKTVETASVTRMLEPLEKRASLVEQFNPEFAQVLQEARSNIENYGAEIPVANAQALKETLQDMSKFGTDDRSRFAVAANKALGRGLRVQLESVFPDLKAVNRSSSDLLTLENELAKATGRIGNRDLVGLGMKVALGGTADVSKGAGILSSLIDIPSIKSRLAIMLYHQKTGTKLPISQWRKAANVVFSQPARQAEFQSGRIEGESQIQP
jgi:hypothetical protein